MRTILLKIKSSAALPVGSLLAALAATALAFPQKLEAIDLPNGMAGPGDLQVTVQQLPGGNVSYSLSGGAPNNSGSTRYPSRTPHDSMAGMPPVSGEVSGWFLLPEGLMFTGTSQNYSGGGMVPEIVMGASNWYLYINSGFSVAPGDLLSGSGSVVTDVVPFSAFVPGTYGVEENGFFIQYVVIPWMERVAARRRAPRAVMVVDTGAIGSANTSGLATSSAVRSGTQRAWSNATRDLNDRLMRQRGSAQGPAINTRLATVAKAPVGKTVIPDGEGYVETDGPGARFEIFAAYNYGHYDQDAVSDWLRGYEVDTHAGTLGFETEITPGLLGGLAWTYSESDAKMGSGFGSVDTDSHILSAYLSMQRGNWWADALYGYGMHDISTRRNTLLGHSARGSTDADSHALAVNFGYAHSLGGSWVVSPFAGLEYYYADIDGYSEAGSRRAGLRYDSDSFDSLVGRLGVALTHSMEAGAGTWLTSQVRAAWAHEFQPDAGNHTATLLNSPYQMVRGSSVRSVGGYTASASDPHPGTDWLEAGASARLDFAGGWNLSAHYNGMLLRSDAVAHMAELRVGFTW